MPLDDGPSRGWWRRSSIQLAGGEWEAEKMNTSSWPVNRSELDLGLLERRGDYASFQKCSRSLTRLLVLMQPTGLYSEGTHRPISASNRCLRPRIKGNESKFEFIAPSFTTQSYCGNHQNSFGKERRRTHWICGHSHYIQAPKT